jgi:hypothetical protein
VVNSAAVDEVKTPGLRGHGGRDFCEAVSDEVDCGGAGEVEIFVAVGIPEIEALAAHGGGKVLAKGST